MIRVGDRVVLLAHDDRKCRELPCQVCARRARRAVRKRPVPLKGRGWRGRG